MKLSRRDLLKLGALGSGGALLGIQGKQMLAAVMAQGEVSAGGDYPLADPDNIIYSLCLQCHTECTLKTKIQNGLITKIDGNPYSPGNLQPQLRYTTPLETAALIDGSICPKGQAGVQTLYDPYRIRKVLKRAGPRGSGKWRAIPFGPAVEEIVEGGKLFAEIGEDRDYPGFREVFALRDAELPREMAADVAKIRGGELTVEEFQSKHRDHLDVLIDPDHPDLGPKNNQFVFDAGRIEHGRKEFAKRWTFGALGSINWYAHTTICEQAHHIAFKQATARWTGSSWKTGKDHMKPDYEAAEFVIFWGTGFAEANFGPPPMTPQLTKAINDGDLKIAVIDPRQSKTAAHGWWIPLHPGGDLALALGMVRWIVENSRFDRDFLANANAAAAHLNGEASWSNATWLIDEETGKFLRASEVGLGRDSEFVAVVNGRPLAVDVYGSDLPIVASLDAEVEFGGRSYKTAFRVFKESAFAHELDFYAAESGVPVETIIRLAREFTSHGKRAAIDFYRGPIKFTYGYYAAQAIIALNTLIGNIDWRGGLVKGGGHHNADGTAEGQPFNLKALHAGALATFGIKTTREKSGPYETSTLFARDGYPAKRPWFPFTDDVYQEIIPAAASGYPYPIKILMLHKGTPVLSTPAGHLQIDMLEDPEKVPLFIASDIVVGETSMYADYVFPDLSYLERWAWEGFSPVIKVKTWKLRQPAAAPIPEMVEVDGEEMPISMEALMIAVAKRLGAPGYGKNGFAEGLDFDRPEDFYLKTVANVAMDGSRLPPANSSEIERFRNARRHLPPAVFDEAKWRRAIGEENWPQVVYLLNRGGRFLEPWQQAYEGDKVRHKLGGLMNLYVEPVATGIHSITGERLSGVPVFERMKHFDGREVDDPSEYDLRLFTYKEIWGGQSRTVSNYVAQEALLPENFININARTAAELGLRDGDLVRLASPTFDGTFEVAPGHSVALEGRIRALQGIAPGAVAVSWHYGHWAYGSNAIEVDGKVVRGDKRRGRGLVPNPAIRVDDYLGDLCLTDPIAGDAVFNGTRVKLVKVADGEPRQQLGSLTEGPRRNSPELQDGIFARWLAEEALRVARGETDRSALRDRIAEQLRDT